MDPISKVDTVVNAVDSVKAIAEPIIKVQKATAKTSLMRLTKDQVFQFPLIMDADINDDEKFPMIKSIEKNYAAIVMTAIVNEGVVDRDKYGEINKFLRRFHNNGDIPFDAVESSLEVNSAIATEGYLTNKELIEMWDCVEEQLDCESINDMYLPYQRTAAKLSRAIEAANLTIATEAEKKYFKQVQYKQEKNANGEMVASIDKNTGCKIVLTDKLGNPQYRYLEAKSGSANYDKLVDELGEPKTVAEWNDTNFDKLLLEENRKEEAKATANAKGKIHGEMIKDDKYNSLTPTILRMNIANIKKGAGSAWSQELIIGVRAMPRLLPQSIMISNMVEAFKDRAIFKFIKWTRGEIDFMDVLFGLGKAREDAAMKADRKWLKVLKNRAKKDKVFRTVGLGHKLNPNTTIIITDADAHLIQEKCGVNPRDITNVRKMMDKYFLLGFGIYDTEAKMLNIIYDGETEFTNYSMRAMIADSKKEANLLSMSKY